MKLVRLLFWALLVTCFLPAVQGTDAAAAQKKPIVIKAGHVVPRNFLYDVGLHKFKEIVERDTHGEVRIEIYGQAQLGSEREMTEACQVGTLNMVVTNTAPMTGFLPEIGIFGLPYLYDSYEQAFRVWDGPIGQGMLDKLERIGIKGLTLWDGGRRGLITALNPIRMPDDLKGLKVRCMEDPGMLSTFKACGAIPTPIPWAEVYTSLQQKTVDVVETCIQMMELNRFYEVAKYVSFTNHFWTPAAHIINLKLWNSLPKETQKVILRASAVGRDACRADILPGGGNADDKSLDNMAKQGMTVVPVDMKVWQKHLRPTYENFYKAYGKDLIEAIVSTK